MSDFAGSDFPQGTERGCGAYLILRREEFTSSPSYSEVGHVADAGDAGDAFRRVVRDHEAKTVTPGEYLIVPLDGAWRVRAEITLSTFSEPIR